ncbi:hypothetical protein Tco_0355952, partial [Tanacetum coccineum]
SSASNAIFEINKLRQQLQGKDDTIRNLDAHINIMKVLNVGSTEGGCDQQTLETDRIQLKDTITSLRIQLDGLKVENMSLAPQQMTSEPNSTDIELTALQSGRSRSALVKDPEPPSVPPTKKQVDELFQWFDDDEVGCSDNSG